jgi:hypothetical protein
VIVLTEEACNDILHRTARLSPAKRYENHVDLVDHCPDAAAKSEFKAAVHVPDGWQIVSGRGSFN